MQHTIVSINPRSLFKFSLSLFLILGLWLAVFYFRDLTVAGLENFAHGAKNHRAIWENFFLAVYGLPALIISIFRLKFCLKIIAGGAKQALIIDLEKKSITHIANQQKHQLTYQTIIDAKTFVCDKAFDKKTLALTLKLAPDSPLYETYPDKFTLDLPCVPKAEDEAEFILGLAKFVEKNTVGGKLKKSATVEAYYQQFSKN